MAIISHKYHGFIYHKKKKLQIFSYFIFHNVPLEKIEIIIDIIITSLFLENKNRSTYLFF